MVQAIPDDYHSVTPYLVVPGAADVIAFLEDVFEAKERLRMDGPGGTIGHAEVQIGDSVVMIADPPGDGNPMPAMLHVYVEDVDGTYKKAITAGAKSLREPRDEFYGDRMAGVQDLSGNQWWIATHVEDVAPDELERRAQAANQNS